MNAFITYILHLADTNLVMSQRTAEWCAHGPILEQDIAITNITLDILGQSRNFYQYAAKKLNESEAEFVINNHWKGAGIEVTEDSLAFLRTEREFKNLLIAELPNGDWAQTITKLFFFSAYQYLLYDRLRSVDDEQLAAIAEKSLKEITYHVKWSSEWVIRLGDGTPESHERMVKAVDYLWMYTGEFFEADAFEVEAGLNKSEIKSQWLTKIKEVFDEATLDVPADGFMQTGGREGKHTEHIGFLLTELQYLQRTYPGATW